LEYKGKRWEYIWMWDQDISIPIPADAADPAIKVLQLKTPAGFDRYVFAFPYDIKNSTKNNQEIAVTNIAFALPIEVEVGGVKVPIVARVNDDGKSNIYKAQATKELGGENARDRFMNKAQIEGSKTDVERRRITIESGKVLEKNWAIFDQNDVDWANAIDQVE